jgi:O-antigen ligase
MAIATFLPADLSLVLTTSAVAAIAIGWITVIPTLAVAFLYSAISLGQLGRLPLPGQGGGVLVSDVAAVCLIISTLFLRRFSRPLPLPILVKILILLSGPFIVWSFWTLLIHSPVLSSGEFLVAAAYWLRLTILLLLFPALLVLATYDQGAKLLERGLIITVTLLLLLGFLQVFFFADLTFLVRQGWDPHQRRLVASWLDPNFFGGFLVVVWPWLLTRWYQTKNKFLLFLNMGLVIGLILTQSRSSLLTFFMLAIFMAIMMFWRYQQNLKAIHIQFVTSLALLFVLTSLLLLPFLLRERLYQLGAQDPTVHLRVTALRAVWRLAEEHSWTGVGYNAYQFAAQKAGLISNFTIHSRAGADNSWLTLWVTTGLPGIILFLLPWSGSFLILLRRWLTQNNWAGLVGSASILGLGVHSQLINSFLYGHLLIVLMIIIVLTLRARS